MFAEECREKSICLISILPDILDTGASGRNAYLNTLKELGDKYKKRKWGFVNITYLLLNHIKNSQRTPQILVKSFSNIMLDA